jgi:hypothetical protein
MNDYPVLRGRAARQRCRLKASSCVAKTLFPVDLHASETAALILVLSGVAYTDVSGSRKSLIVAASISAPGDNAPFATGTSLCSFPDAESTRRKWNHKQS